MKIAILRQRNPMEMLLKLVIIRKVSIRNKNDESILDYIRAEECIFFIEFPSIYMRRTAIGQHSSCDRHAVMHVS